MWSCSTEVCDGGPSHSATGPCVSGRSHTRRMASRTRSATLRPERSETLCRASSSSSRRYTCVLTIGVILGMGMTPVNESRSHESEHRCRTSRGWSTRSERERLRCDTGVTRRRGVGWEAVASHPRISPKNQQESSAVVSGGSVESSYEPGGRRFESCRARHNFQIHSENNTFGLPSQPVRPRRTPSNSAWQTAWQGIRVADRVAMWLSARLRRLGRTGSFGRLCDS